MQKEIYQIKQKKLKIQQEKQELKKNGQLRYRRLKSWKKKREKKNIIV